MLHKIGILCASDTELAPFLPHIQGVRTDRKAMLTFHTGRLGAWEATAVYSGAGKVNAAVAAQLLIDAFGATAVINAGTAGGLDEKVGLFDTVVTQRAAYHDMDEDILTDFHPWMETPFFPSDPKLLAAARMAAAGAAYPIRFGDSVTGDTFVEGERRAEIRRRFAPLSVDMETAAAAQVCYVHKIPFLAVRTITDTAEADGPDAFEKNCERASAIAADFVRRLLDVLAAGK